MTGANSAAMKLAVRKEYEHLRSDSGVGAGGPIPGANAVVTGYRLAAYSPSSSAATVVVVLTADDVAEAGSMVSFVVSLRWQAGDWRVVAPPDGDWGSVATPVGSPPAGMLDYHELP